MDLSALLLNLSPEALDLWKQPIPTTPPSPSRLARKLQRQRRLVFDNVQQLILRYQGGRTVAQLAKEFGIHRTTVIAHIHRSAASRARLPCVLNEGSQDGLDAGEE